PQAADTCASSFCLFVIRQVSFIVMAPGQATSPDTASPRVLPGPFRVERFNCSRMHPRTGDW
ncbi:MAG: hypothetical protein ACTHJY_16790, partial [Rhizobiaceae bacterium]